MIGTENEIAGDGASNTRESSPNGHLLFYDGDGQEWRIAGEKDLLDGEKDVQTESHSSALQLPALDAAGLSGFVWRPSDGPPKAVSETRDSRTHGFLYAELLRILRRIKRVAGDGGPEVAEEHKGDPPRWDCSRPPTVSLLTQVRPV